jgi:hypothetical protein
MNVAARQGANLFNLPQGLNPTSRQSEMQARERFFSDRTRNLHAESPASRSLHGLGDTCVDTL